LTKNGALPLRIIIYPRTNVTRAIVNVLATLAAVGIVVKLGLGSAWWVILAWYLATFVGFHVLMVPLLTLCHEISKRFDRYLRSIIEEELIRFDLQNYEKQLRRVFPGHTDRSEA